MLVEKSSRNWCFTLNNPQEEEFPEKWNLATVRLVVYQQEMETTPHLQGYIEFMTPRRLQTLKALSPRAHWEPRRRSRNEALLYCVKQKTRTHPPQGWTGKDPSIWKQYNDDDAESFWISLGFKKVPVAKDSGSSSKTSEKLSLIREGLLDGSLSIKDVSTQYFELWLRYERSFERFLCMHTTPRNYPTELHVIYGPTETGKSKYCNELYPDAYWKPNNKWWCGYARHETVIIDEFYAWLPYDTLLRLADRYPLLLETKGGQTQFVAKRMYITSNKWPDQWYDYSRCYQPALARRIVKYHYMPEEGVHEEYDKWEDFHKCR